MIGIFDSGVGGLTVAKEIFKRLPEKKIIYFGDTARLPYGTKGADFVRFYSEKITGWLKKRGAKTIVIACHTSSAWAADYLKEKFKDLEIFEMLGPAAKEAVLLSKGGTIGIIGTPGTVKSGAWKKKILEISPKAKIVQKACPLFVPLVEEGIISGIIPEKVAENYLKELRKEKISVLVLACTHYPVLRKVIQKTIGRSVKVINPAESLAKEMAERIDGKRGKHKGEHSFYFSDEPYNLDKISQLCFKKKIKGKIGDPF
jgi:glutamate racemase